MKATNRMFPVEKLRLVQFDLKVETSSDQPLKVPMAHENECLLL